MAKRNRKSTKTTTKTNKRNAPRRRAARRVSRPARRRLQTKLTEAGMRFLQCAFAPPDFTIDPGRGIPDDFQGKSFMDKPCLTQSFTLNGGERGTDTYFVAAPMPGIAAWTTTMAGNTPVNSSTVWTALPHPGAFGSNSLFGDAAADVGKRADNVNRFRYASLNAGVYTTSSLMNTAGTVQVWKAPLTLTTEQYIKSVATTPPVTVEAASHVVLGLESCTAVPRDNFSQALLHGVYSVSTNNQEDFRFQDIHEGISRAPSANYTGSGMFGVLSGPILGMGDMDAIFIKVAVPPTVSVSIVFKVWSCIEYRPNASSIFDRFSGYSPPPDPIALAMYRKAALQMPLAVVSAENAKFWETILRILGTGASIASYVPGPVGVMGAGASALIQGLRELTV